MITTSSLIEEAEKALEDKEFDIAEKKFNQALDQFEEQGNWEEYFGTIQGLAEVYLFSSRIDKTFEVLKAAVSLAEEKLGKVSDMWISRNNDLGFLYLRSGNNNKGQECIKECLVNQLKLDPNNYKEIIPLYINLADSYVHLGDYEQALLYMQQGLHISQTNFGEVHLQTAKLYNNVGGIMKFLGNFEMELEYFKKTLEIFTEIQDEECVENYITRNNIGSSLVNLGRHEEAQDYFSSAYKKASYYLGPNDERTAFLQSNLGVNLLKLERYKESFIHLEDSFNKRKAIFGLHNHKVATSLLNISKYHFELEDWDSALKVVHEAIISGSKAETVFNHSEDFNPLPSDCINHLVVLDCLSLKADILFRKWRECNKEPNKIWQKCLNCYLSIELIIDYKKDELINDNSKFKLAELSYPIFQKAVRNILEVYAKTKDDSFLEKAFQLTEKCKSILLRSKINFREYKDSGELPSNLKKRELILLEHEDEIRDEIEKLELSGDQEKVQLIENAKVKLFEIVKKKEEFYDYLKNKYPTYFEMRYFAEVYNSGTIAKELKKKEVIISYFFGQEDLHLFVIRRDNTIDYSNCGNAKLIKEEILKFQNSMQLILKREFNNLGQSLFAKLIPKNIRENLSEIKRLICIPDRELLNIDFGGLLLLGSENNKFDYSEQNYLLNHVELVKQYSAGLWYQLIKKEKQISSGLLAIAPGFVSINAPSISKIGDSISNTLRSEELDSLPQSKIEVKRLGKLFTSIGQKSLELTDSEANIISIEAALKVHTYKFIHIASHGKSNLNKKDLAGILLSASSNQTKGKVDNGGWDLLSLSKASRLPLNADLVTLSCCDSGLGIYKKGEGNIALVRSLLIAGCSNVVCSLQKIYDKYSKEFMVLFYDKILRGSSYSKALQETKIEFIKKGLPPKTWACFILIGK